jgi:hypothetical protein
MAHDAENLRFNALRNALYHTARRRYFERWNRAFNFMVVLLGAAAITDPLQTLGIAQVWVGVAVAAVGAGQLVFDFGGQARDHQSLQRDYYNVLAEMEECDNPTQPQLAGWAGKMTRIAGDEPPVYRALDAKAYNDALGALEIFQDGERVHIPLHQRILGGIFAFDGYTYRKLKELPGYKASAALIASE